MKWVDYMVSAAQHSKGSASHWFRYLRKDIDKCGVTFSMQDVEDLSQNTNLTMFQRVSLKAAFSDGTPTRQYIQKLNQRGGLGIFQKVREQYESSNTSR